MRDIVIAGIGSTSFGQHPNISARELSAKATAEAIYDSGLLSKQIGALYLGNFISGPLSGQEVLAGLVSNELGLGSIPATKVEGACASGGIAFRHACLAVSSGMTDAAIAVGVEKMSHAKGKEVTSALNCAMDNDADAPSGLTFPGLFGLVWRGYAEAFGATRDQVSSVVCKNKSAGLKNPLAHMGANLTNEEISAGAMIASPIRIHDCCPVSDGAAAVVVARADIVDKNKDAISVLASVQTSGSPRIAGHKNIYSFDATVKASEKAFNIAGIGTKDLSLVELHDCFSIAEIIDSEDLGIVPRGEGAAWAFEGRTNIDGDIPINPSGGLLSKGHPVGATGVGQIFEACLQLRGKHSNQVKDARFAMTHNLGGAGVACTVSILGHSDA